ncbi:MAG: helix-turn-helix domain-containing protein [Phocaeicola plebeius]
MRSLKEHLDFSIDAVVEASGFKSRATFYRAFHKVFGMTPAQYLNSLER